jgi:hypothetical protein
MRLLEGDCRPEKSGLHSSQRRAGNEHCSVIPNLIGNRNAMLGLIALGFPPDSYRDSRE